MENAARDKTPVLRVLNVCKSFGKIQALKDICLEICPGEVVGLLGDNGAGKSTLIKIIAGNLQADSGQIYFNGRRVAFSSPTESRNAGIETVYQNSPLCNNSTVSANFYIGRELAINIPGLRILRKRGMQKETHSALSKIGVNIPAVTAKVGYLSGGQRQSIVLGRFFHWGGQLALLDEPFAALGVTESRRALQLIQQISKYGLPILLVTHNIEYAFEVVTKFIVLRNGEVSGSGSIKDTKIDDVVSMITGSIHIKAGSKSP